MNSPVSPYRGTVLRFLPDRPSITRNIMGVHCEIREIIAASVRVLLRQPPSGLSAGDLCKPPLNRADDEKSDR